MLTTSDYHKLKRQTEKEKYTLEMLWQVRAAGLPEPDQEAIFHPTRKWRMDLAWKRQRVALEIHGAVFVQGRHTRGAGFTEDRIKMAEAQLLGWIVIEVTPELIKNGKALELVERALKERIP